jgi:hypothetical protein
MSYSKTFVCLANSTKNSGRCIAGIEIVDGNLGGWIRPVSARPSREISEEDRRFENGQTCSVLDIVSVRFERHDPFLHQTENHLINAQYYWQKIGTFPTAQLAPAITNHVQPIWPYCGSTNYGRHDRIPEARLPEIQSSLSLVQPGVVDVVVSTDPGYNGAPGTIAVRANFTCGGEFNSLKISDPTAKARFMGQGIGTYRLNDPILCVSLAEPWAEQPYAFKVVAAINL